MSNQVFLWSIFILPWLPMFFMKKEIIKRFISTALLSVVMSLLIVQIGEVLEWWVFKEYAYPLRSPSYVYSLNPIITILIFRFTYGRFWLYLVVDVIANLGFAYPYIGYFLTIRGIVQYLKFGAIHVVIITTAMGVVLYWYQMWQEGIFVRSNKDS
jgi:hypothetical protein